MRELALHLLDIAHNSVAAKAADIDIEVEEKTRENTLRMVVRDNGMGMSEEMVARIIDPFVTSRTTRKVGLGIPLLKAAAEACNGNLQITSKMGEGTCLEVRFERNHIDRMPLGDLSGTIFSLVVGAPEVHWVFRYQVDDKEFLFDDREIKENIADVLITEPAVMRYLQEWITDGVNSVSPKEY